MNTSPILVRALASSEEYRQFFLLAGEVFTGQPTPENAARWQERTLADPDLQPEHVRAAFRDDQLVGGYLLSERRMRMGVARIPVVCVSAVFAHPAYRQQGIATALMRDATSFAADRQNAFLLLDGIPKFYYRYGYADVFDLSSHLIDRSAILAQEKSANTVRTVTPDDAEAILALYNRQYGSYTGGFARTLDQQRYQLQYHASRKHMIVSRNQAGTPEGYLLLPSASHPDVALECAAVNWPALLSLLQYHALLYDGQENIPPYLHYRLPLDSPIVEWMIQHLEVPDTLGWDTPHEGWSVLSRTYHHRYAGCMARLVDAYVLLEAMLPELQARWRQTLAHWEGEITLAVESETPTLRFTGRDVRLITDPDTPVQVQITPQGLMQLAFGYRSIASLVSESSPAVPQEIFVALTHLFPTGHTWIAGSDWP